jgi:hypothetical protein
LSFLLTLLMVNFLKGFTKHLTIRAEAGTFARIIPSVFF